MAHRFIEMTDEEFNALPKSEIKPLLVGYLKSLLAEDADIDEMRVAVKTLTPARNNLL